MANRRMNQYVYSFHKNLTVLHTKFKVLSTAGTGITPYALPGSGTFAGPTSTALVGGGLGINQIYMYSSNAATGNNVASANMQVQFSDPYATLYDYSFKFSALVTGGGTSISAGLSLGVMYQIVTVGTSTAANWQAIGLPAGVTPAVGQHFIASTASAGTGTGTVKALVSSGITSVELGGDPDLQLSPNMSQIASGFNGGAAGTVWFNLYRTTTLQQPSDGTVVQGTFWLGHTTSYG